MDCCLLRGGVCTQNLMQSVWPEAVHPTFPVVSEGECCSFYRRPTFRPKLHVLVTCGPARYPQVCWVNLAAPFAGGKQVWVGLLFLLSLPATLHCQLLTSFFIDARLLALPFWDVSGRAGRAQVYKRNLEVRCGLGSGAGFSRHHYCVQLQRV